jgi:hypothetical protein
MSYSTCSLRQSVFEMGEMKAIPFSKNTVA